MIEMDSLKKGREKVLEAYASSIPGVSLIAAGVMQMRLEHQYKRFELFINYSGFDEEYMLDLKDKPEQQELVLEYIETILTTPLKEVCIALALILKDGSLSDSSKSIYANSLKGLSRESYSIFMQIMDDWDNREDVKSDLVNFSKLEKNIDQIEAFKIDLCNRGLCKSEGFASYETGDNTSATSSAKKIYKFLSAARSLMSNA